MSTITTASSIVTTAAATAAASTASSTTPFYFTTAAVVIPAVTGSVSFLSSGVIIYVIVRSRIYSTYHRIMLGTSIADCVASLAIALTTLPMPKDVIYPFATRSFGNTATCEAQGLAYTIGNTFLFYMSFLLNVFYLCTLTRWFRLKEERFQWLVELPLFVASLLISFLLPLVYFTRDVMNPSPNDTFCSIYSYPQGCSRDTNPLCRGDVGIREKFAKAYVPTMIITLTTLLVTMILIVLSFHLNERVLRKRTTTARNFHSLTTTNDVSPNNGSDSHSDSGNGSAVDAGGGVGDSFTRAGARMDDITTMPYTFRRAQETKRVVTRQAIMYILAFFFSHGFSVLSYVDLRSRNFASYTEWIAVLRIIFQPLQGFFNMLIFLHHKVYSIRRDGPDKSFAQALKTVLLSPNAVDDPIVSSIEIVMMDEYLHRKSHGHGNNVRSTLRRKRNYRLDDGADDGFKIEEGEDHASYIDHLSISEIEESVNSEVDYVSGVNDASFTGSQPTIQSFIMSGMMDDGDISFHTGPSTGSGPITDSR